MTLSKVHYADGICSLGEFAECPIVADTEGSEEKAVRFIASVVEQIDIFL